MIWCNNCLRSYLSPRLHKRATLERLDNGEIVRHLMDDDPIDTAYCSAGEHHVGEGAGTVGDARLRATELIKAQLGDEQS